MTSRLLAIAGWLATGHALLFGLFWLLLSIPESTVAMLVGSALVVALMALLFGWVEAVGLLAWQPDAHARELPRHSIRAMPGVWLGAVLCVVVWYLVGYFGTWWAGRQGETDAWLMVKFGWANTGKLHLAVSWLFAFLRFVGVSMSVSLAAVYAAGGLKSFGHARTLGDGLSPRHLLMMAAILIVFMWLPWRGVNWRPAWLAPNWQETAFVGVKLSVVYVLANIGWALVLGGAAKKDWSHRL